MMAAGSSSVNLGRVLAVGAVYALLAVFSLSITRFGAPVESIWLSNAVLVWALVTSPRAAWPVLFLAGAAGHLAAHLIVRDTLRFTAAFIIGDMFECLIVSVLLQRRPRALAFEDRGSTFYFLFVCALAPLVSSIVFAAVTFVATGAPLSPREAVVWISVDALGLLVFLPLIHAAGQGKWPVALRGKFVRLALALAAIIVIATISAMASAPLLRLLVLPLLVLVAFEIGVAGVQIALATAFLTWTVLVYLGFTPRLFGDVDMRDSLLLVQVLIGIFTASFLPLAVVLEEKQRLNDTLAETLQETREAWGAIIGAEARYRLVVDNVSETVMRVARGGKILFASPACTALLHADRGFEGRNFLDLLHPDDRAFVAERAGQTVDDGLYNLVQRWKLRMHGDDGVWYAIDARVTAISTGKTIEEHEYVVVLRSEHEDERNA